ncbi:MULTISPECIES: fumarylacetoacetate hydrolase family protein [Clostridium]|jgi:2-keto-4-pentenoate hydratase/2-oxohepta-3-ene-1,7-dioic acid hydratase in catechol pathway|uniref:Ureidoglycolate lyase n=1 Tax=Clostridium thermopalmarium DSM 5974 TaxID=1121340 RepID=A0A2T0ANR0_9CLOT|nr:fumarylacetoacetate hydrolase family protein [Clostridium thermopalmarium]PRR70594.1 Ureidoglycolate lyase [Clostridium thermopalmarium DSM 5974]PVZ21676.1 2-keto-4-pentenoate hydratase/2-oxohepta-3-ene-1,7-dioic acid hydratase in catechol pathway [Clostridium thermopalmarium DSM 5974]
MKFISFKESGEEKLGVLSKDGTLAIELSSLNLSKNFYGMIDLVNNISDCDMDTIRNIILEDSVDNIVTYPLNKIRVCAPIKKPIHDIICVGVNYKDHLEETKESFDKNSFTEPKKTVYFSKRVTEAIGPEDKIISHSDLDEELDYEVELAVIIGKRGINIPKDKAEDYIFGYTIMNDISARALQQQHLQWYRGKSLDTFTALGPVVVHKSEIPFPVELNVCSRVNGELRQNSNTKLFLTDIPSIIAEISSGMTLEPGDIIATGTPSGVGMGFKPPRFMKSGDVVECEIENIGILKNIVE